MALRLRLKALRENSFTRSASVLIGATAAAQGLTVLALPILTRIYSPEEFSLLAVYVAILTIVQVLACLRLEIAIPLPENDVEAANLLALALVCTASAAVLVGFLVQGFGQTFFAAIGQPKMLPNSWLLPFGIWLAGSYAALLFWSSRKKRFPIIARTRMMQAGSGLAAQLGLGWAGAGSMGLMLGHALMAGAGVVKLTHQVWRCDRVAMDGITLYGMRQAIGNYRRFPLYSTWEALANNAAIQLPVLLIAALAVGPDAGFILLAMRAVGTPVSLIGGAVGQVYLSHAPEEMRSGRLPEFTLGVLRGLARLGVAPMVFLAIIAPSVFALVFGEEWRRAGDLVVWMTPWFMLKLLSSPIAMVMHVRMMQRAMLGLMVAGLLLRIAITVAAYSLDPNLIAEGYALSGAIFYLIAFYVYLHASGAGLAAVGGIAKSFALPTLAAALMGLTVSSLISGVR